MSAKLFRSDTKHGGAVSFETMRPTGDFGNNAFRRKTLALVLDQQRVRSAFQEWERWKKACPAGRKMNR